MTRRDQASGSAACSDFLSRPLRVTVVCPSGQVGGAERWLLRLLDATRRTSVSATVLGSGPLADQWRARGVATTEVAIGQGRKAVVRAAIEVRRQVSAEQPDVVLANGVRAAVTAMPSAWLQGTPVVWVKHDHAFDGLLTRLLARSCAAVVAPSATVGGAGTGRRPVVVPPPREDHTPWDRSRARERLASMVEASGGVLPEEAPLALAVGARIPLKGLGDAIAAIAATTSWHLAIIGSDDASAPGHGLELEAAARALGVQDRVHFLGSVPEAAPLMSGAEALVQLTRPAGSGPGREGYGMTVLEAACAGVAVVCTPCPAADDLIRAGGSPGVRLVPPGAPDSVRAALTDLAAHSARQSAGAALIAASDQHPTTSGLSDRLVSALAASAGRAGAGVTIDRATPVSVVAPLFTEGALAAELVRAVVPQLRPGDELIAVDDASTDDTAAQVVSAARQLDVDVQLIRRPANGGVGAARNSGVRAARHDTIVFVDAGTRPAKGWLDAMRAAAVATPTPGLLAGSYAVSRDGAWQSAVAAACYPSPRPATDQGPWRRIWHAIFGLRLEADAPAGRALGITRGAWRAIDGFDERRRAAEDVDAGRAVAATDLECVLVADALVEWDQTPSWRGTAAMYRHYGRGDAQAEHRRAVVRDVVRAAAYVVAPVASVSGNGAVARRTMVAAAALTYASVPLLRGMSQPHALRVVPLVPLALMVKDLAKAWGAVEVLARRAR